MLKNLNISINKLYSKNLLYPRIYHSVMKTQRFDNNLCFPKLVYNLPFYELTSFNMDHRNILLNIIIFSVIYVKEWNC